MAFLSRFVRTRIGLSPTRKGQWPATGKCFAEKNCSEPRLYDVGLVSHNATRSLGCTEELESFSNSFDLLSITAKVSLGERRMENDQS